MIKIGDVCVVDYYFCDATCKYIDLNTGVCNRISGAGVEKLVEYDKGIWYRTEACKNEMGFVSKVDHVKIFKEDTFTDIDGTVTLYDFLSFFKARENDGKDVILIVKLKNGKTMVLAEVNLLGGVCDDCVCDEMNEEVVKYSFKKIEVV